MPKHLYLNPIPREGGIYVPPTIQINFSREPHEREGSKYTQNLSFVISSKKNLPTTACGRPPEVGG